MAGEHFGRTPEVVPHSKKRNKWEQHAKKRIRERYGPDVNITKLRDRLTTGEYQIIARKKDNVTAIAELSIDLRPIYCMILIWDELKRPVVSTVLEAQMLDTYRERTAWEFVGVDDG